MKFNSIAVANTDLISEDDIIPSATLPTLLPYTINQIADGITSDDFPYNGFASTSPVGTITLDLVGEYNLRSFLLWNDINVQSEGIKDFRLDFFDPLNNQIPVSFSTSFVAPLGKIDKEEYIFGHIVPNVSRVDLVVLSSNIGFFNRIEIREIAFTSLPLGKIFINDALITEGNSGVKQAKFTVSLSEASTIPTTINYATANDTAKAGQDYSPVNNTLTFKPGQTTKTISVPVIGDTDSELDETFFVDLTNPNGLIISDGQGIGTIVNDDAQPIVVSINDITVTEGNSGTSTAKVSVTRFNNTNDAFSVKYATASSSAKVNQDFINSNGTLNFAAGQRKKTINITIKGDTVVEPTEKFFVNLSAATNGAIIEDNQGIVTVKDKDIPTLSIKDIIFPEGNSGRKNANFIVSLSAKLDKKVSVKYATVKGTANSPQDFLTKSGILVFNPGQVSRTISIPVKGDILVENNETFSVKLSGAVNGIIQDSLGRGTIINDDQKSNNFSDRLVSEQVIMGSSFNPILNDFNVTQNDFLSIARSNFLDNSVNESFLL